MSKQDDGRKAWTRPGRQKGVRGCGMGNLTPRGVIDSGFVVSSMLRESACDASPCK